ncbi:MAG: hypothetical protein SGJ24_01315 [Chloroflexota bacterium]|nr:hypothetical protein [Chloroflexota bacterium]
MRLITGGLVIALGTVILALCGAYSLWYAPRSVIVVAVLVGMALIAAPLAWTRGLRPYLRALAGGIVVAIVGVVGLEGLLWAINSPGITASMIETLTVEHFSCEGGCHKTPQMIAQANYDPSNPDPNTRSNMSNTDGFMTRTEFDLSLLPDDHYRILASGDSMSVGFLAAVGRGYLETLETAVPDVTVWNTAFPGTNLEHIVKALTHYAPLMQPDLIVIGLNQNNTTDFMPRPRFAQLTNGAPSSTRWIDVYSVANDLAVVPLTDDQLRWRYHDVEDVNLTLISTALLHTRIGYQLVNVFKRAQSVPSLYEHPNLYQHTAAINREWLTQIRTLAESQGIPIVGVLIPTVSQDTFYPDLLDDFRALIESVGIAYLDLMPLLTLDDYRNANSADTHWNTAGHEKVGALLTECVTFMIAQPGAVCPQAWVPSAS